jgi:hypothetical protein
VTGTDANDVITLTRLDDDRVQVTVQSFLDADWTQPTGDPVTSFEAPARGFIGVNGGAGHDQVRIVDPVFGHTFLWGTNLHTFYTVHGVTFGPDGSAIPHTEQFETSYARLDATEAAPATVTDGAEIVDGTEVQVGFDYWIKWIDDPVMPEPLPLLPVMPLPAPWDPMPEPGTDGEATTLEGPADGFPILDDAVLMVGEGGALLPAVAIDPGPDGDVMPGRAPDQGDLSDLWVQWADDESLDQGGAESGYSDGGSDAWGGENMDDWRVTDLEAER